MLTFEAALQLERDLVEEAYATQQKTLALLQPIVESYGYDFHWYDSINLMSSILMARGQPDDALRMLDEALATRPFSNDSLALIPTAPIPLLYLKKSRLGLLLVTGAYDDGVAYAETLYTELDQRYGSIHPELVEIDILYALLLRLQGHYNQADSILQVAQSRLDQLHDAPILSHAIVSYQRGLVAADQGYFEDAHPYFEQSVFPGGRMSSYGQVNLGRNYLHRNNLDSAHILIETFFPDTENDLVFPDPIQGDALLHRSELLLRLNQPDSAIIAVQRALKQYDVSGWHARYSRRLWGHALLGQAYLQQGRYAEAESLLVAALTAMHDAPVFPPYEERITRQALRELYTAWQKPEQAAAYRPAS